jgi:UDP-3-O-[3-hydroxymyristoyl] glucosamine N-acyltransferase
MEAFFHVPGTAGGEPPWAERTLGPIKGLTPLICINTPIALWHQSKRVTSAEPDRQLGTRMVEATLGNARFFRRSGPYSLADVASTARGVADELELLLEGVAPLQTAGSNEVSFLDNRHYASALDQTSAGAVIVHPDMAARVPAGTVAIRTTEPYAAWARVAALFYPLPAVSPGIHPSAMVAEGTRVDPSAEVGPLSVIEAGAEIGPGCRIGPCAVIGSGVIVGRDCRIGAHASLSHALLGARVYIYPGARIGQEGFGFASTKDGFLSVPQLGRVILEDDVEVGANSTIDRGSSRDTVIGAGSRLDNLVQIGHNVILGRCCVIVAQVGISGSTVLEDFVRVGGQAAMAGHLRIGQGAEIGAQAGIISDVDPGAKVLGSPAQPKRDFFRQIATLKKMAKGEG